MAGTLAFVVPTLRGGGAERVVSRLSSCLARTVPTVVISWDARDPAYVFGGHVVDAGLPAAKSIVLKVVRQQQRKNKIRGLLSHFGVTRVVSFMESASIPVLLARESLGAGVHVTVAIRISPSFFGPMQRLQIRYLYPRADRIVLQTDAGRAHAVNSLGLPAGKCRVIPNPVDSQFLGPPRVFSSRIPGLVVGVGRLEAQKRFADLIAAFACLPRRLASRLVIVGSGSEFGFLSECAQRFQVGERVSLVGETPDVIHWLDRCSAFVLASEFEGFPNALAEAMARGCPVVSTDCETGPCEMIKHGVSGLLVPVGDVGALSRSISQILDDREFALKVGSEARQAAEKWSLERIAPLWL